MNLAEVFAKTRKADCPPPCAAEPLQECHLPDGELHFSRFRVALRRGLITDEEFVAVVKYQVESTLAPVLTFNPQVEVEGPGEVAA